MRSTVDSPGQVEDNNVSCKINGQQRVNPIFVPKINGNKDWQKYGAQDIQLLVVPVKKVIKY